MTRTAKTTPPKPPRPPGRWLLQDAKARFSELVRRVRSEGPQHVTVHGRDEGVAVSRHRHRAAAGADARARGQSVTGWLLDTNILSELRRLKPEPKVVAFV